MRMNRRNVLVGLGTIVAGGGAALGTGAFSQVSADRTVSVSVAQDSNALLGLTAVASTNAITDTGGESGNEFEITLDNVNDEAITTIGSVDSTDTPTSVESAAFTITNNSDTPVDVSVSLNGTNPSNILELPTQDADGTHDTTSTDFQSAKNLVNNDLVGLESDASADVVVLVNTETASDSTSDEVTGITFTAEN